jgi:N6-L-threonylcarbamoyladenine synthase
VVEVLVERTIAACRAQRAARLVLGGGVSANQRLRERMAEACREHRIELRVPELALCVDNGVMVAALGDRLFRCGWRSDLTLAPVPDAAVTAMLAVREAAA